MAGNLGAWFALLYKHCPWADKVVTSFLCPTRNKPNAEKPRFTTKFMHKAVKQGNGKQDLALLPWSQEGCSVYGMSRDEEGGPQFSSVAQSCPILCEPVNRSTPGLPVHHQLPESTQTHVNWVCDVIQPSHPLLSPSPPAATPSQHQGIFQWVNSSHEVAKVLGKGDSCRKEVRSSAQAHWVAHLCIF